MFEYITDPIFSVFLRKSFKKRAKNNIFFIWDFGRFEKSKRQGVCFAHALLYQLDMTLRFCEQVLHDEKDEKKAREFILQRAQRIMLADKLKASAVERERAAKIYELNFVCFMLNREQENISRMSRLARFFSRKGTTYKNKLKKMLLATHDEYEKLGLNQQVPLFMAYAAKLEVILRRRSWWGRLIGWKHKYYKLVTNQLKACKYVLQGNNGAIRVFKQSLADGAKSDTFFCGVQQSLKVDLKTNIGLLQNAFGIDSAGFKLNVNKASQMQALQKLLSICEFMVNHDGACNLYDLMEKRKKECAVYVIQAVSRVQQELFQKMYRQSPVSVIEQYQFRLCSYLSALFIDQNIIVPWSDGNIFTSIRLCRQQTILILLNALQSNSQDSMSILVRKPENKFFKKVLNLDVFFKYRSPWLPCLVKDEISCIFEFIRRQNIENLMHNTFVVQVVRWMYALICDENSSKQCRHCVKNFVFELENRIFDTIIDYINNYSIRAHNKVTALFHSKLMQEAGMYYVIRSKIGSDKIIDTLYAQAQSILSQNSLAEQFSIVTKRLNGVLNLVWFASKDVREKLRKRIQLALKNKMRCYLSEWFERAGLNEEDFFWMKTFYHQSFQIGVATFQIKDFMPENYQPVAPCIFNSNWLRTVIQALKYKKLDQLKEVLRQCACIEIFQADEKVSEFFRHKVQINFEKIKSAVCFNVKQFYEKDRKSYYEIASLLLGEAFIGCRPEFLLQVMCQLKNSEQTLNEKPTAIFIESSPFG